MIPQIIHVILLTISIGYIQRIKGKSVEKNVYVFTLSSATVLALYYWGGFFDSMKWPQYVMIVCALIALIKNIIEHGKTKVETGWTVWKVAYNIFIITILWFGHFFDPLFF